MDMTTACSTLAASIGTLTYTQKPQNIETIPSLLSSNMFNIEINVRDSCSPIQYMTSGAGSKAWRGDIKEHDSQAMKFFHDGQGFMSVNLTRSDGVVVFYDVLGRVLHTWKLNKQLHSAF